jgi:hypothetical protein
VLELTYFDSMLLVLKALLLLKFLLLAAQIDFGALVCELGGLLAFLLADLRAHPFSLKVPCGLIVFKVPRSL